MRRMVGLLGVAVALLSAGPAGAVSEAGGDAGGGQEAFAAWIFLTSKDGGVFYFADAYRVAAAPDGVAAEAVVGKGQCVVTQSRDVTIILCFAAGRPHAVSIDQFQMDPLLRSASLHMNIRHRVQRVRWTGLGDAPAVDSAQVAAPGFAGIYAGEDRAAAARATLFGRTLGKRGFPFAFLSTYAAAEAYSDQGVSVSRSYARDGTERLRYEIRVPR